MNYEYWSSPLGEMLLAASSQGLTRIEFKDCLSEKTLLLLKENYQLGSNSLIEQTKKELQEYYKGERLDFDLPIDVTGTEFQEQVWQTLQTIPYGLTWSYEDLAQALKKPKAMRAVGSANGRNPVSILVPCHRVIAKSGGLGGYAGGLDRKKALLHLEMKTRPSL